MTDIEMRVGQGFDVHRFGDGDHLILGGVRIPHKHGLVAHSDGDVLLHALTDAVLGALGQGDIGQHFPDNDPSFSGADSAQLLRHVWSPAHAAGWQVANVDLTVIGERPKVGPFRAAIKESVAHILECSEERVNIKATTTEKLGFTGRGEGLAAQVVVLLQRR